MSRALLLAGLPLPRGLGAREYSLVPLPRLPGKRLESWQRLAARKGIELSASWLLSARGLPALPAEVAAVFRGCVTGLTPGGAASEVRRLDAEALRSRVLTDFDSVRRRCARYRRDGLRLVFTNGVFDLFHVGHLRLLEAARALGDVLVVGVNSDESARRLKGRARPSLPQFARAELVAAVRAVDLCVIFPQGDPRELLRAVRPHVLAKGSEYTLDGVVGRELVESWGGRVELVPHVPGWSTTALLQTRRV